MFDNIKLLLVVALTGLATPLSAQGGDKSEQPKPIRPVRTLGTVSVVDTLPTGNSDLNIVLYNDNSWRYVRSGEFVPDSAIFEEYWDTSATHAYKGVELSSLPESVAIQLVDSLQSYHYPYVGKLSSRYGMRSGRQHQGVDLPLKTGDPIYATFDGKVRYSKSAGNYGNLVVIRHNNGLETYYAHLSKREVEVGDWVLAGQVIGLGGSTGRSTGPHLHYEVRYKGQSFDPERIVDFATGELRNDELLLKSRHFSIYAKYEQNFDDETEAQRQADAEKKASSVQYHTVRSGENLSVIARKYGTTVNKLCSLNGIKSTTILSIGRKLRVR